MKVLPPGTLLQLMYLRERLQHLSPGFFIEIGPGSGEITQILLDKGWSGCSYDLEAKTVSSLEERFKKEIAQKRFQAFHQDYLLSFFPKKANLIISSMVMEHLGEGDQLDFLKKSAEYLDENGIMIGFVPASPMHWGIEDDIAGHFRRYTRSSIRDLAKESKWQLIHISGLTFPISNLLLPISNFLVKRNEKSKLSLSTLERTKQSGRRQVKFKTHFPSLLGVLLNEVTLFPLHMIQKLFRNCEKALVLYFELKPN